MEHGHGMDRRRFLRGAASLLLAAHLPPGPARAERRGPRAPRYEGPEEPRILHLDLRTAVPLAELRRFYHEDLEMTVLGEESDRLTVAAGVTRLTFRPAEGEHKPVYHFAFNIPENKLFEAREWQRERTPLLRRPPDAFSHPDYDDVTDFWHWNAHSIFFEDPAGNLLEYIARHDLPNAIPGPFAGKDILYASEIGFIAQDVPAFGQELQQGTGLDLYFAGGNGFRAFGDPNGLLLVLQRGAKQWASKRPWAVHPTVAGIRDGEGARFVAADHPYTVALGGGS